jgi:hypothetical protein
MRLHAPHAVSFFSVDVFDGISLTVCVGLCGLAWWCIVNLCDLVHGG